MIMNVSTQADTMVDSQELRQKYIDRTEVLDKVKKLFLIPQLEMMTARQIAEFYEVDYNTIKLCYQRNRKEIDEDGTIVKKPLDFGKIANGTTCTFRTQISVNVLEFDGVQVVVSNKGARCFSKRAVLRFGMLLRDSKVAQEVRTQLLNVVEHVQEEKSELLTEEIDKEKELLINAIGVAAVSGDINELLKAQTAYNAYMNRHVAKVEAEKEELTKQNEELAESNEELHKDNDILSGNILEWSNRASANKIVRLMAQKLGWEYGKCWNAIYDELKYKHGINLKLRQSFSKNKSKPYIEFLKDDEWECLYKTIAAMLQARYVNPSKIFEKAKREQMLD